MAAGFTRQVDGASGDLTSIRPVPDDIFGNPATCHDRPSALRPRLTTGVLLSESQPEMLGTSPIARRASGVPATAARGGWSGRCWYDGMKSAGTPDT
jgi:hypothetical protein